MMFKKLISAILMAMMVPALAGCALTGIPESPGAISDATVLDEKAADLSEQAYVLAVRAGELAVDAGLIKGQVAVKLATLDNKAYAGLLRIRAAYQASNQTDYVIAVREFKIIIDDLIAIIKGGSE